MNGLTGICESPLIAVKKIIGKIGGMPDKVWLYKLYIRAGSEGPHQIFDTPASGAKTNGSCDSHRVRCLDFSVLCHYCIRNIATLPRRCRSESNDNFSGNDIASLKAILFQSLSRKGKCQKDKQNEYFASCLDLFHIDTKWTVTSNLPRTSSGY